MAHAAETLVSTALDSAHFVQWEREVTEDSASWLPSGSPRTDLGYLPERVPVLEAEAVRTVPSLEIDVEQRQRAARFIGQVAAGATIEQGGEETVGSHVSLLEALRRAHEGGIEARRLVEMNVRTDVIERTIKAGHVMKVALGVNEQGQVLQHGQTAEMIQANSLRYAADNWQMRERTEAETRNMFRIEALHKQGVLADHAFVVISRAADNMTLEQAGRVGFFTDTMSCAIQVTTAEGQGLTTESAFVAGKVSAAAGRHDAATVAQLGDQLGVDLAGKTAAELIDTPLLVPKWMIPNGAVDLVRLYDAAAGGTFFGEAKPTYDYLDFLQQCQRREAELEPTVQQITAELIAQAAEIRTPVEATQWLGKMSGAYLLRRAVTDERIDGRVFGVESAVYLEAARLFSLQGDVRQAELFLERAVRADASSSCPGAGVEKAGGDDVESADNGEGDGDCDFVSKQCPLCGAKNVKTMVRKLSSGLKHISGSCGCSKIA